MKGGAEIYKPPTILSRFRANQACLARTRDAWAAPRKKKTFPSGCNSCLTLISRGEGEEGGKKRIVRLTSSFYDAFTWALYTPSARHTTSRLHGVIKLSRWWCYNRQFLQKSSRRGCRSARLCRPTAASRRVSSLSRCSRDRRTWKFLAKRACITHKLIHTHTHTHVFMRETRSIIDKGRAEKTRIVLYATVDRERKR